MVNAGAEDVRFLDDSYCVINTLAEDISITNAKFDIAVDLKPGRVKPKLAKCAKRYADGLYMRLARAIEAEELWQKTRIQPYIAEKLFLEMRGCSRLLIMGVQPKTAKTAAAELAARCGLTYKDMDTLINEASGAVSTEQKDDKASERGEQGWTVSREDALMAAYRTACSDKNTVVACCERLLNDKQGMEYFRQCGFVNVFIDRSLERIAAEMFANNEFFGENGIEAMAELHELCGASAAKRLHTDEPDGIAERLFNMLAFDEY